MVNTGKSHFRAYIGTTLRLNLLQYVRYHSHYHSQLSDGARGPMLIHPAASRNDPFHMISGDENDRAQMKEAERDPRIVMTADWSAYSAQGYDEIFRASGLQLL